MKGIKMKWLAVVIVIGLSSTICFAGSLGNVIVDVEARIDRVFDPLNYLEGTISTGDILVGVYSYEVPWQDSNPSVNVAEYWFTGDVWSYVNFQAGGHTFQSDWTDSSWRLLLSNNIIIPSHPPEDRYGIVSYNNYPLYNGTPVLLIDWLLAGNNEAIESTDILLDCPTLADWHTDWGINIVGGLENSGCEEQFHIRAYVTSIEGTYYTVPEPSAVFLLAIGGFVLTLLQKKNNVATKGLK